MTFSSPETDRRYSREEFRRWCEAQPRGRYERVDGRIVAMAPERGAHLRAKIAVYKALERAIATAGIGCQALPDGATVETGDSDYEPDALANCGEPMADDAILGAVEAIILSLSRRLRPQADSSCLGAADLFGWCCRDGSQHGRNAFH